MEKSVCMRRMETFLEPRGDHKLTCKDIENCIEERLIGKCVIHLFKCITQLVCNQYGDIFLYDYADKYLISRHTRQVSRSVQYEKP